MGEILLTTPRFRVEREDFQVPGAGTISRVWVVHPGAVVILPLLGGGDVVLIRNDRHAVGRELLELPAGTLEPGEEPIACAGRELEEETGYRAGRLQPLCEFYSTPGFTNEKLFAFVASDLEQTVQRLEPTERIRVEVMSLSDALDATVDGRIIDAKTIAALQVYHYREARSV